MKRSTYERLLKHLLLPFNCQPYLDALERIHGCVYAARAQHTQSTQYVCHHTMYDLPSVPKQTLTSIYSQEAQKRVIQRHALLKQAMDDVCRRCARWTGLLHVASVHHPSRYLNGEDIIDISYDLDFPPCIVMRRLLESLPIALHRQVRPTVGCAHTKIFAQNAYSLRILVTLQQITKVLRRPPVLFQLLSKAVNNTKQPPQSPKATTPAVAETPTPGTTPLPSMAHTTREPSPTTPITPASEPGDASEGPSEEPPPLSPREAFVQSIPTLPLEDQDTAQLLLRLHDDACRCVEADTMYAPRADAARHDAGVLYEAKLANRLQELGLDFLSEEMLRAKVCSGVFVFPTQSICHCLIEATFLGTHPPPGFFQDARRKVAGPRRDSRPLGALDRLKGVTVLSEWPLCIENVFFAYLATI